MPAKSFKVFLGSDSAFDAHMESTAREPFRKDGRFKKHYKDIINKALDKGRHVEILTFEE